ncbi:MAG: RagB/SusD family nutrient uptake outer membrane protein [Bacteroidales bacterium]|jgi:hypothetical protein|nr:RagB/SusD family nutrient uptake outer membrane protein [Bacteroidales bacterium]
MKKIIAITVLLVALVFTACEDRFDKDPLSLITSQNMWSTESEARAGITGMYSRFRSTFNTETFLIWFEFRSGFWKVGASGAGQWDDLFLNTPNATSTPSTNWNDIYRVIGAANLALKYIPEINFSDDDVKNTLLADAFFIRAFCYFALGRIWGNVPLITTPIEALDDENLYSPRSDVDLVFGLVKDDIDQALTLIADDGVRNRIMASRAAINMLKADVYLWTAKRMGGGNADLTTAQAAAEAVIADANYELWPSYEEVFRVEQNRETIFSIYFDALEGSQNQYGQRFTYQANQVPAAVRDNPVPIGSSAQWHTFTDLYVNNYLNKTAGDIRKDIINQDYNYKGKLYRWVNKYMGEIISGTRVAVSDTRIYRFAEAILFRAEAMNGLGDTPGAILELNKIAKRAYGVDDFYPGTLTPAEVDSLILHERLIEFGAEGKSWFDIVRFGKAFELVPTLVGRENDYQGNILLMPVSPSTITNNPKVVQTPGY